MPNPIVYAGRPGAGKSTLSKQRVIKERGCHLFAASRCELIDMEIYPDIDRLRKQYPDTECHLHKIHSQDRQKGGSTVHRIETMSRKYDPAKDHCCFVLTHASLIDLDLGLFAGWHLHLDEVVMNAVMSGDLYSPTMWRGLNDLFEIVTTEDGSYRLTECGGVQMSDVLADKFLPDDTKNLFKRVQSRCPVIIDCADVSEIGARRCAWTSTWTLANACEHFASVEISASDITDSMMFMASPIGLDVHPIVAKDSFARIRIESFNSGIGCSALYWQTDEGRSNLRLVADYLAPQGVGYWTTNESAKDFLLSLMGETTYVSPQQEGANGLRKQRSCAVLLSMKAQAHESVLAVLNSDLDLKTISRNREGSAIRQFVTRGQIRDSDFNGDYYIAVYDDHQAFDLQAWFLQNGYLNVSHKHVELDGFVHRSRTKAGPKPSTKTVEEQKAIKREQGAARQARYRAKKTFRDGGAAQE